jgi:pimeloyl-ACP methyl ester carboxylesterase
MTEPSVIDAVELLPRYVESALLHTVRDTHRAIAARVHGLVNLATADVARPVELAHRGIAEAVYASIGVGLRAAGTGARFAQDSGVRGGSLDSSGGRALRAAVNGLLGDELRADGSPMALGMTIRLRGEDVPVHPPGLANAFPQAQPRIVVLLHGLGENDQHWNARRDIVGTSYPEILELLGWTPVVLRYNSGLSVRENGVALASLIQSLVEAWPTDVRRIAMIGHSMGGLVVRASCAVATDAKRPWPERLSDVVTLGTPHLGADLAKLVQVGSRLLARVPETSAFSRFLDHRSVGIDDLSDGLPDLTPSPRVRYHLVAATLGDSPRHPLGDILVRMPSAYGRRRRRQLFPQADVLHLPRTDHFGLLNHHDVHLALKEWLS